MTTELQILFFAMILGMVQLMLAAHFTTLQRGVKWNLGNRDSAARDLTGAAARLDRAFKNFMETFPFFAAALLIVHVTGRSSQWSTWGAQVYLAARVLYVPIYGFGIPLVRTAIWSISMLGLLLIFVALF